MLQEIQRYIWLREDLSTVGVSQVDFHPGKLVLPAWFQSQIQI